MRAQLAEEKQRAAVLSANMEALSQQLAQTQAQLAEAQAEGAAVAERLAQARANKTTSWSLRRPLLTPPANAQWLYRGAKRS